MICQTRHRDIADQTVAETASIVDTFQSLLQIAQLEGGAPRSRFADVDLGDLGGDLC